MEQLAPSGHRGHVRTLSVVLYASRQNMPVIKSGVSSSADLPPDHVFSHAHLEQAEERQVQPRHLPKCA